MPALRMRIALVVTPIRRAFGNRDLRRLQLAWAGALLGNWTYAVGLAVFAYQAGGPRALALVALIRAVPAALASPFASTLGDRYPPVFVMLGSDLVRASISAAMVAGVLLDAPPAVVYALAAALAASTRAYGPAQAALIPSLARTPDELTAANAFSMTLQNLAIFVGPALGGLLLAAGGPALVFGANGASYLWSALLVSGLRGRVAPRSERPREAGERLLAAAFAGFGGIARQPGLRVLMLLGAAQIVVYGALTVFIVVLSFRLLDTGAVGVGLLQSALGVGGLVGSVVALSLAGTRRLGLIFGVGTALWGLVAVAGVWPNRLAAPLAFAAVGLGSTLADVSLITLIQRMVDKALLARVFGVVELLGLVGVPIGAALAPPVISWLGLRPALVATGLVLPVLAGITARRLLALDAPGPPARELDLLRSSPIFASLPLATLERLAMSLTSVEVPAGTAVVRQGEPGDRFYLIAKGEAVVTENGRSIATLKAGDSFGEIALLRDVPRTATVEARSDLRLLALPRDEFVSSVVAHPESAEAADGVVSARLERLPDRS